MNIPKLETPFSKISNLLYVSYLPKVINAAIEVELFEMLSQKRHMLMISEYDFSLNDIAERLNIEKSVTEALLNVLSKIGLVSVENGSYGLTTHAEDYLIKISDANQLHAISQFSGSKGPFDYLLAALKGESIEFDGKMWSSKEAILAMEQGTKAGALQNVVSFVRTIPEFSSCIKMCDFAGSIGYYSYALLNENENLYSHVCDLPSVCEIAKELKQNEKNFNRVTYNSFDIKKDESFGEGYDLFFSSHFLYEFGVNGELVKFFKRVNWSMKPGGIFVSNHVCDKPIDKESDITLSLVELQTRIMGYPTHQIPESILKEALTEAGFGEFRIQQPDGANAFPTLLLSAKKIKQER